MKLERRKAILIAAVRDYIKSGKPISSKSLYQNHAFNIRPAMIRAELHSLGKDGYFYQRHPSGGRLPTDKAYRFFVNHIFHSVLAYKKSELKDELIDLIKYFKKGKKDYFIECLANQLKILSVGYEPLERNFYHSGFEKLIRQLNLEMKNDFLKVVEDFEFLPRRLKEQCYFWENFNGPRVFIGKNPLTSSSHLALILDKLAEGKKSFLLLAIGPKRMDYQKSLKTLKVLKNYLEND